jgi:hypothetical protein
MRRLFPLTFVLLSAVGCGTIVVVDGHEVNEPIWQATSNQIRTEAAFLFKCDAAALKLTILETFPDLTGEVARVVGVDGCGQTAVYKLVEGKWFLDGVRTTASQPR